MPIPAFLVEHPGAGPLLIDTGFHPSVAANPQANLGRLSRFTFKEIEMRPEQAASAQLRARGIEPTQVKVVLITHLHIDHASAISEYPDSTFLVSAAEWAASRSSISGWSRLRSRNTMRCRRNRVVSSAATTRGARTASSASTSSPKCAGARSCRAPLLPSCNSTAPLSTIEK